MEYWLAFIMGGIAYIFKRYLKNLDEKFDRFLLDNKAMKAGIQVLLRDRIRQSHNFLMNKGFATVEDRDAICNMYEQYHNLGANGVVDNLMDEISQLPVIEKRNGINDN